jgi:hypothetical protein
MCKYEDNQSPDDTIKANSEPHATNIEYCPVQLNCRLRRWVLLYYGKKSKSKAIPVTGREGP